MAAASSADQSETQSQPLPRSLAASEGPSNLREALPVFAQYASPRILLVALVISLGVRISLAGFSPWDVLPVVGLLLYWPIQEWLIHVFVLHYKPRKLGRFTLDFRVPRSHRLHHEDPWNIQILFIPLHSYLYTVPIVAGVWYLVTPTTQLAWTGITAHLLLALHYEWVHYLTHTRVKPRSRYYQRLFRNHRLHHFKNENYWYGVTMLSGDNLLRTAPASPKQVETSPTARSLLGQELSPADLAQRA